MSDAANTMSVREALGPAAILPLQDVQSAPELLVDAPLPEALARGLVVIQYRAVNLRIVPVFGAAALDVTPRIGHIHVTVDDAPWHWADASGEPLIIQNLPAGSHVLLIELVDANHKPFCGQRISFVVPAKTAV